MISKIVDFFLNLRKWLSDGIESIKNDDVAVRSHDLLGEGFSGSVYKCRYKNEERALKIFYETFRKNREENIYKILEKNKASFVPRIHFSENNYFVMDLLRGDLFYDLLEHEELNNLNDMIIITNILDSYFELHKLGIVHVDIRSMNITVDSDFTIKIFDFGDSWVDTDFIIDLTRIVREFLDIIDDPSRLNAILSYAQDTCKNHRAFMLFREFYEDEDFKWMREQTSRVSVATNEYYAILVVRKVFNGLDSKIEDFNRRYLIALRASDVNDSTE